MDSDNTAGAGELQVDRALPPAAVSAIVEALERRARQAGAEGSAALLRGSLGSVAEALGSIESRLERLEAVSATRPSPPGSSEVAWGTARVGGSEGQGPAWAAVDARLGRLEEALVPTAGAGGSGADGLAEAIEGVRKAIEEAHLRQEEVLAVLRWTVEATLAAPGRPAVEAGGDEPATDGVAHDAGGAYVAGAVRALAALVEQTADAARAEAQRQAELLTQRVASLSVTLEAVRTTVEQVASDLANSPGRKATEAGRRLAADLGIWGRRLGPEPGRGEPRELGRGGR